MFTEFADTYTGELLPFSPTAPAGCRRAWEALSSLSLPSEGRSVSEHLIREAEEAIFSPWPQILAADYLDFSRTGNRERFETKQFSRRTRLNALILGECCEHQGRFLDAVIDGLYLICEETAWQLPAHNSYIRDTPQLPLPDVSRPVLDLFAAETGAVLAAAAYVMKEELDSVSPLIVKMIRKQLKERIFTPYLTEHFWWMGDGHSPMNNWTVWCTQNVLLAAFLSDLDQASRQAVFKKACRSIDYFLAEYGEDGCCDEGAQYYRHAGLCLFNCLELLNGITGNHFSSLYQEPKIKNIASYILKVHVADGYYINFSDCSPIAGRCGAREYLFGARTGQPELMALAAADLKRSADPLLSEEHNLFYRLQALSVCGEMLSSPLKEQEKGMDVYFPSTGLLIARDEHFCLAVKAGSNDDSHNHNDTGSFTLYQDGKPLFIDVGVETYQKKTFSPRRYEIWTMQSQYHNLLSFRDSSEPEKLIMEQAGPEFGAENTAWKLNDREVFMSMELAPAFGHPKLRSWKREMRFVKGEEIRIRDQVKTDGLLPVLSLMTYEEPVWDGEKRLLSIGAAGRCRIQGCANVQTERIPITDPRLRTAWKHDIWRVLVEFEGEEVELIAEAGF